MKTYGSGGIAPIFLILPLDGGEWSASSHHSNFTSDERAPCTHSMGNWMGPRAVPDDVEKRKISFPAGNQISAFQPVVHRYTDRVIQAYKMLNTIMNFNWEASCKRDILNTGKEIG
jgi:hypothetical protein